MMQKTTLAVAAAAALFATGAQAYDGTNCKAPGVCWEPKPGFPDKVAGSGAGPVQVREATEKTRELHQAYTLVRQRRGF